MKLFIPAALCLCAAHSFGSAPMTGTAQALANFNGSEDRHTIDLATNGTSSGAVSAVFNEASSDISVTLTKAAGVSMIHIVHTLDSGSLTVGGSSSDGIFTFTLAQPADFAFTGLLEQSSTDPGGGILIRIRRTTDGTLYYQRGPDFGLPNTPVDFSTGFSSGTLPAGDYEFTWFHAANNNFSSEHTVGTGDFTLALSVPGCNDADFTSDGVLDIFDVFAFLDAFNAMDPAADFTDDGSFDIFDVFAFLDEFNAGCP